jgi:hypothetical protein
MGGKTKGEIRGAARSNLRRAVNRLVRAQEAHNNGYDNTRKPLRQAKENAEKAIDKLIAAHAPPRLVDALDAAVMKAFDGVTCETTYSIFSMQYVTRWFDSKTGLKLPPSKARRVKDFAAGFSAAMEIVE